MVDAVENDYSAKCTNSRQQLGQAGAGNYDAVSQHVSSWAGQNVVTDEARETYSVEHGSDVKLVDVVLAIQQSTAPKWWFSWALSTVQSNESISKLDVKLLIATTVSSHCPKHYIDIKLNYNMIIKRLNKVTEYWT